MAGMSQPERSSLEIAVNSYGIVLPPQPMPCRGDDCKYIASGNGCESERHHLHPGRGIYEKYSKLAKKFRDLRGLSVWMQECIHDELHDINPFAVEPPDDDVMQQCIREGRILKAIGINAFNMRHVKGAMDTAGESDDTRKKLDDAYKKHFERHQILIEKVAEIEVTPEQLVTGCLLLSDPALARRRINEGTGFALTASSRLFRPEIFDPVDDLLLGGVLHEGQVISFRPKTILFEDRRAQAETGPDRSTALAPVPIAA